MDKHILRSLKRLFLKRNKEILCSKSPDAYNSCSNATTVHQFIKSHHTFAGCSNMAEYYAENNPIDWIPKVRSWSEYPDNNPDNLYRWEHRYCSSTVRTILCAWRRIYERTLLGEKRSHQLALKSDYKKIFRSHPGALLLRTPRGSHISFNEGLLGTKCFLSRICMDFLDSAKHIKISTPEF